MRRGIEGWQPSSSHIRARRDVAAAFGVTDEQVLSRSRARPIAHARQAAAFVLRKKFGARMSFPCIAKTLGLRDHSTVIYAVQQVEYRIERDPALALTLARLCEGRVAFNADAHVQAWLDEAERVRAREVRASRSIVTVPGRPMRAISERRAVKPKNALDLDDHDALMRADGSERLADAIASAGGWR